MRAWLAVIRVGLLSVLTVLAVLAGVASVAQAAAPTYACHSFRLHVVAPVVSPPFGHDDIYASGGQTNIGSMDCVTSSGAPVTLQITEASMEIRPLAGQSAPPCPRELAGPFYVQPSNGDPIFYPNVSIKTGSPGSTDAGDIARDPSTATSDYYNTGTITLDSGQAMPLHWHVTDSGTTPSYHGICTSSEVGGGVNNDFGLGDTVDLYASSPFGVTPQYKAPVLDGGVAIAGYPDVGNVLQADHGEWQGYPAPTYAYQWQRCDGAGANCSDIPGETNPDYEVSSGDVGSTLKVTVTATNDAGSASASSGATPAVTPAPTPPSNIALPSYGNTPAMGQTLSGYQGSWSGSTPMTFQFQWRVCDPSNTACHNIPGATEQNYTVTAAEVGQRIVLEVNAGNEAGSQVADSTPSGVVSPTTDTYGTDPADAQTQAADDATAIVNDPMTPLAPPIGPSDVNSNLPPGHQTRPVVEVADGVATAAQSGGALIGSCDIHPGVPATTRRQNRGGYVVSFGADTDCRPFPHFMSGIAFLKQGGKPRAGNAAPTVSIGNGYRGTLLKGSSYGAYPEVQKVAHFIHYNSYVKARAGASWALPPEFVPISSDTECRAYKDGSGRSILHCISNSVAVQ